MKRLLLVLGLAAIVGGMVMWRRQSAGDVPFDHADATETSSTASTPSPAATVIDLTEQPAEAAQEKAAPTT